MCSDQRGGDGPKVSQPARLPHAAVLHLQATLPGTTTCSSALRDPTTWRANSAGARRRVRAFSRSSLHHTKGAAAGAPRQRGGLIAVTRAPGPRARPLIHRSGVEGSNEPLVQCRTPGVRKRQFSPRAACMHLAGAASQVGPEMMPSPRSPQGREPRRAPKRPMVGARPALDRRSHAWRDLPCYYIRGAGSHACGTN